MQDVIIVKELGKNKMKELLSFLSFHQPNSSTRVFKVYIATVCV